MKTRHADHILAGTGAPGVHGAERPGNPSAGHELLDELRELRLAIIDGWLPEEKLRDLAGLAASAREEADERGPAGVPDERRSRAAVEVAKLGRKPS